MQVSQLDQLCSGNLDTFLEEANRIASREHSFSSHQLIKTDAANGKHAKANAAKKQVGGCSWNCFDNSSRQCTSCKEFFTCTSKHMQLRQAERTPK